MKKCLLLLMVLTTKICEGQLPISGSSTGTGFSSANLDTLCFPVPVIRKVLIAAEQKKVADSLLKIAELQVSQLQNSIRLLNDKDIELKSMYNGQLENLHQQIELYKSQIAGYEKLLRKERRLRRAVTAGGIAATGIMFYIYLTK